MRRKKITRATRHARPQMRKRPQKLDRLKEFDAAPLLSALHSVALNHSSWILWRLPFSDSARIAVDKSSARGESLGKACNRIQYSHKMFRTEVNVCVLITGSEPTYKSPSTFCENLTNCLELAVF